MVNISEDLPINYKVLSDALWKNLKGSIAGSSQPGYYWIVNIPDKIVLENLKNGKDIKEAGVDPWMFEEFSALDKKKIDVIYSLASAKDDRDPHLLKWIWENKFNKTFITEVDNINLATADFEAPSIKQLEVIANDAIVRIKNGEKILITCGAGIGRTGTVLAAIIMKLIAIYDTDLIISYIRKIYSSHAVEAKAQYSVLCEFAEFNKTNTITNEKNLEIMSIIKEITLKNDLNLGFDNQQNISLTDAVIKGNSALIKSLLENNQDVNQTTNDTSPLIEAAKIGKPAIVKLLIKYGADVNICNSQGQTPLIKAIINPSKVSLKVILILLENKADINTEDIYGNNALFYAENLENKNNKYKKELLYKFRDINL